MSVVYVHGVATRKSDPSYHAHLGQIEALLERYVCPSVGEGCGVFPAYWGSYGAAFSWDGQSRPRSVLLGQGASSNSLSAINQAMLLASLGADETPRGEGRTRETRADPLVASGPRRPTSERSSALRFKDLRPEQLSDLLSATIVPLTAGKSERVRLLMIADDVAHDEETRRRLTACASVEEELRELLMLLKEARSGILTGHGAGSEWNKVVDRLGEIASRLGSAPAYAVSTIAGEWRRPINELVTVFLGDVFTYIGNRGTSEKIGAIPRAVIDTLEHAKSRNPSEPLVVLTHSMGGQIVYDLVSYFLPSMKSNLRVDFWCATASQVGLFEEMKLFCSSQPAYSKERGNKVPRIDQQYLGGWWNVWDHNDFISYTSAPIFEGVDDEAYDSGASMIQSHSEYLLRPSFYRHFAKKVESAKRQNWWRP
jgi:hypothetical protein